ncbi:curli assembly chaperone CsgC [Kosakonia sp. BYX6]|uniref:Curli assembly protein CsgC n=1 Tax=Kosakonia calanthes TaxID=3139408 RepID=A0ABZ3B0Y7_9ENTR
MHNLLLLAALSSQITFTTAHHGDVYTVTPLVQVAQDCVCQIQIITERQSGGGMSQSRQRNLMSLIANQPTALSHLTMNIPPDADVRITVTVSDGQSLQLVQQWSPDK